MQNFIAPMTFNYLWSMLFVLTTSSVASGQFVLEATTGLGGQAMYSGDYENAPPFVSTRSTRPELNLLSIAAAAPFAAGAFTSGHTTLGPGFDASARFTNAAVVFDDSDNLRSLIPSQNTPLDVFLNFRARVRTSVIDVNNRYMTSTASVSLRINSLGGLIQGDHILRSGDQIGSDYSSSSGVLQGLSANGGVVDIAVPLKISPYNFYGLSADVDATVSVFSIALFELDNTATSFIFLRPLDGPGVLTLADGRTLSELGVTYSFLPDQTQGSLDNPFLPTDIDQNPGRPFPTFNFVNVLTNGWYDPPIASGFVYTMTDGSLFDQILDFPPGFENPFLVHVGDQFLGQFSPGQSVDFVTLLGQGVTSFKISGIEPLVDPEDVTAFPLKLAFNTPVASFTMQAVPEPSTLLLVSSGTLIFVLTQCRRLRSFCS